MDTDGVRLARVERELLRRLKSWGVTARVICLGCGLEIARQGFTEGTPALLMNQYTVSSGVEITSEILEEFCKKLVHWLTLHDSSDNDPASSQIP
ncbi:MAG: hypothetical protein AB9872_13935 [Solidesulfovibrio sp.]